MAEHKRVSIRHAEDAIYNLDTKETQSASIGLGPIDIETECYTVLGNHDILDENDYPVVLDSIDDNAEDRHIVYAKKVAKNGRHPRFYVKRSNKGLFDPLNYNEGTFKSSARGAGMHEYAFREVTFKAFQHYMKFLTTKNKVHLRSADRETL